ncbi:MAG: glycosyl hydrolase family 18 protein [Bacteroidota bacterium]
MKSLHLLCISLIWGILFGLLACQQPPQASERPHKTSVIAYYAGDPHAVDQYAVGQLDQIIHCFLHLKGNKLALDEANDSIGIANLVALKGRNPELKILLSLGGWGGCETCSDVFSEASAREEFAQSVLDLLLKFEADGIDLDWEYPGISGYPGHAYKAEDKQNFTYLVQELRQTLGESYEISFAAAGFDSFFVKSIEWDKVMPLLNRVNIMTYDLVSGFSKITGHHSPLYSTEEQVRSTHRAVSFLDSLGVPREQMVIGGAFYARVWENVPNINNGLYQPGTFKQTVRYSSLNDYFAANPGFELYWDESAQAPYAYNADSMWFATFDDTRSIALKTQYARKEQLGGIMFWQLATDTPANGLLEAIHQAK